MERTLSILQIFTIRKRDKSEPVSLSYKKMNDDDNLELFLTADEE